MFSVGEKSLERLRSWLQMEASKRPRNRNSRCFIIPYFLTQRQVAMIDISFMILDVEYSSEHQLSLLISLEGLLV